MEFNITSSTLNTSYDYKDVIIVQGSYIKDAVSGNLTHSMLLQPQW